MSSLKPNLADLFRPQHQGGLRTIVQHRVVVVRFSDAWKDGTSFLGGAMEEYFQSEDGRLSAARITSYKLYTPEGYLINSPDDFAGYCTDCLATNQKTPVPVQFAKRCGVCEKLLCHKHRYLAGDGAYCCEHIPQPGLDDLVSSLMRLADV